MKSLLILFFAVGASAANIGYDAPYSTATVGGIRCSTGTAIDVTPAANILGGFYVGGYRLQNQDSADNVYFGYNNQVSTDTNSTAHFNTLGEILVPGADKVEMVGKNPDLGTLVKLWCLAIDAAGASGVILSRTVYGYK